MIIRKLTDDNWALADKFLIASNTLSERWRENKDVAGTELGPCALRDDFKE